jgi:hypothetical protein
MRGHHHAVLGLDRSSQGGIYLGRQQGRYYRRSE